MHHKHLRDLYAFYKHSKRHSSDTNESFRCSLHRVSKYQSHPLRLLIPGRWKQGHPNRPSSDSDLFLHQSLWQLQSHRSIGREPDGHERESRCSWLRLQQDDDKMPHPGGTAEWPKWKMKEASKTCFFIQPWHAFSDLAIYRYSNNNLTGKSTPVLSRDSLRGRTFDFMQENFDTTVTGGRCLFDHSAGT